MQVELKSLKGDVIKKISASDDVWTVSYTHLTLPTIYSV